MPDDQITNKDSVLRGLFGTFTAAAEAGMGTAEVWSSLRSAATDWATSVVSVTAGAAGYDEAVSTAAQTLLQGVTIQDVNTYRAIAGAAVRAKNNLQSAAGTEQIVGTSIFQAPWSVTGDNPAIPTRYRLRVLRNITVKGFTQVERNEWASYDLGINITSVDDAIKMANDAFNREDYNKTASINSVLDYSLEVV